MSDVELDPRWEWIEIADLGKRDQLCLTCDGQLPPSGYEPAIGIIPLQPKVISRRRIS